jgi:hypothetical protein
MVAYFTEGSDLIARDEDYAKLPQHLVVAPWFIGEVELATTALERVVGAYPRPLPIATGAIGHIRGLGNTRYVEPRQAVRELHHRVVSSLGDYYLSLENPDSVYEPAIVIDPDQPPLPASLDFEIDHLAVVEDHGNGSKSITECVLIG